MVPPFGTIRKTCICVRQEYPTGNGSAWLPRRTYDFGRDWYSIDYLCFCDDKVFHTRGRAAIRERHCKRRNTNPPLLPSVE
jgi:hypothetical protein